MHSSWADQASEAVRGCRFRGPSRVCHAAPLLCSCSSHTSSSALSPQLPQQERDGDLPRLTPGFWDRRCPDPCLFSGPGGWGWGAVKATTSESGTVVAATAKGWSLELPTGQEPEVAVELWDRQGPSSSSSCGHNSGSWSLNSGHTLSVCFLPLPCRIPMSG